MKTLVGPPEMLAFLTLSAVMLLSSSMMSDLPDDVHSGEVSSSVANARFELSSHRVLSSVEDNLSGITVDAAGQRLLMVVNQPPQVLVTHLDGRIVSTVPLIGFSDTEAIVHIEDDLFAIADERHMEIVLARIKSATVSIDRQAQARIALDPEVRSNKGIEGLAYDRAARTLYAAQEKSPKRIYRIRVDDWLRDSVPPNLLRYELEELWVPLEIHLLGDISGLHFDDRKRQLLVLSDESKRLIAIDMGGRVVRSDSLASLTDPPIPQAEGVVLDSSGELILVSEPNHFYRFTPVAR